MDETATGFWKTVGLLLKTARRRSGGRRLRQQQLLNKRSAGNSTDWGSLGTAVGVVVMAILHGCAAFTVISGVQVGQQLDAERQGKTVVQQWFLESVQAVEQPVGRASDDAKQALEESYAREAKEIVDQSGGQQADTERRLRATVAALGSRGLLSRDDAEPGLSGLARSRRAPATLGSVMLLWWFAMVICQGEGLELDLQRRRHPMWEWLLSHPVSAGAVFFAEMLSPLSANPIYWTAPLFVGILYGAAQGPTAALAATVLIGVPLTLAAACVGKALENGAVLRLPVRSRGAVIGVLSWFGYASLLAMFFGATSMPRLAATFGQALLFLQPQGR